MVPKDSENGLTSLPHPAPVKANPVKAECGCRSGMVALLIGLTLSTYFFFFREPATANSVLRVLYVLLISLGCAVLGKIVGILVPRFRRGSHKNPIDNEETYVAPSL
jgi:hypothetical protein